MYKRVVQVDNYDEVELQAGGLLQMRVVYKDGKLMYPQTSSIYSTHIPGIITSLKEEGLYDEQDS